MAMDLSEFEQQHFVVQQVDEPSMSKSLDQLAMVLSVFGAYLSFVDFGTKPKIEYSASVIRCFAQAAGIKRSLKLRLFYVNDIASKTFDYGP